MEVLPYLDMFIVLDDDSKLKENFLPNLLVPNDILVGSLVFVGCDHNDEGDFISLSSFQVAQALQFCSLHNISAIDLDHYINLVKQQLARGYQLLSF